MRLAPLLLAAIFGCAEPPTFAALGVCGGEQTLALESDVGGARQAIIAGELDHELEAVGAVLSEHADGVTRLCSGVLITRTRMLTAAHCLHDARGAEVRSVRVGFDAEHGTRASLAVRAWRAHPEYRVGRAQHDLAVLELAEPADVLEAPVVDAPPCEGQSVLVVGFGVTDVSDPTTAGVRRSKLTEVDSLERGRWSASQADGGSCVGDSGGPALVYSPSVGTYAVVGITARGHEACTGDAYYARVDGEREFLMAAM